MEDDRPKVTMVVLTAGLARRSLAAANAAGLSRSAWMRALIESALDTGDTHD